MTKLLNFCMKHSVSWDDVCIRFYWPESRPSPQVTKMLKRVACFRNFFSLFWEFHIRLTNPYIFSESSFHSGSNDMQQAYILTSGLVDIVYSFLDDVMIYKKGHKSVLCLWIFANFFLVIVQTLGHQKNIVA